MDVQTEEGQTALHITAKANDTGDAAELLLSLGALRVRVCVCV